MALTPGTRLGPYEITASIGAGGMGEVYSAKDSRLGRDVAIKVLPTSTAHDPDRRARFEREAQAVAALSHPNVIALFDTGVHEQQLYVVMELLSGETLRERLGANPAGLAVRKAIDVAVQIARGLGAAHAKGIVHRDLKPENVFLLDDGQVKILDFGLARQAAATEHSGATRTIAVTDPGTVMGTVGYMAPEQVRGQAIDARADVFAFGAVLYEMVSGLRAFQRDTAADTMSAILTQEPPELVGSRPDLSPALDRIIRHCLEKNANERFQNARDIAFALESIATGTTGASVAAAAPGATSALARAGVFNSTAAKAAVIVGVLLLGAIGGFAGRGGTTATSAGVADVIYKPVTFEEGFVYAARFASDGRTIVYSADWDGQPRGVYVTSLDSSEYRSLGFPGADLLGISRAGELAILGGSTLMGGSAYMRRGTLAKASLTGGAGRPELDGVLFADVAPDNAMAVIRDDGRRFTVEYPVGEVLAEMAIVNSSAGQSVFAAIRVSPSGDHVAFFDDRVPGAFRVKVFDRAGKFVTESRPFVDWWAPAWTPSNEVWFAAAESSGNQTAIFSLDLEGRQRTVFRAPGAITLHDISSTGDVLVSFDRGRSRAELIEPAATTPEDRSWRENGRVAGLATNRALLINGTGDSGGPGGSVYVWQPKQPQPIRIADGSGLAISPDGTKAVVVSLQTPPRLSVVPTGAGQAQAIDIGPFEMISWAGWLRDGRLVLQVVRPGSPAAIFVLSASGRDLAPLLPAGVTLRGANLISPDASRMIALDAAGQFIVCTIATPACRPASGLREGDVVSGWAADGESVFVYQPQPMQAQVDRVDVGSGGRSAWKTVRPLNPAVSGVRNLIVAPDGAIAYGYGRSRSELYVIKGLK